MAGFEGWGDFDGSPYDRYVAHQAAKGNLWPVHIEIVEAEDARPECSMCRPECSMCRRGWHHECWGCGCPCNADEDDAA